MTRQWDWLKDQYDFTTFPGESITIMGTGTSKLTEPKIEEKGS